jgi:pilus assembly protein CpaB
MNIAKLKSLRPNKTWVVLGVALAIGLLAALAARSYLANRVADLEAKARGKNVNVVVAKADLPKGSKLSSENVAVRPVPSDYAHSSSVLPDQFDRIEGQALAFNVKAGEAILWSLVEGKKVPTFSARVDTGRRAITVPVDEINSISGLLEPGDLIDLLVTIDQKGKKITVPLLQSVRVMATGQRSVDDPKSGERRLYSTVTLDTDPQQAQNVVVAREAGRLTALLRNPEDKLPLKGIQGDLSALLGATNLPVAALTSENVKEVPVLYGGRAGKIPPEALRLGQYARPAAAPINPQPAALIQASSAGADGVASPAVSNTPVQVQILSGGASSPASPATQPTSSAAR